MLTADQAAAHALFAAGEYARALSAAEKILNGARGLEYRALQAEAAILVGDIHFQRNELAPAHDALVEAVWAAEAARHERALAQACTLLMSSDSRDPENRQASIWRDCARAALERLGDHGLLWSQAHSAEADLLDRQGRVEEAVAHYKESLATIERATGTDQNRETIITLLNLGVQLTRDGRTREALPILARALPIAESVYGKDHPDVGRVLTVRSFALAGERDFAGARADITRALGILERAFGADNADVADLLENLANIDEEEGHPEAAAKGYERVLDIRTRLFGPEHRVVGVSLANLGLHYVNQKDFARAIPQLEKGQGVLTKSLAPDHPQVAQCLVGLGQAQLGLGHLQPGIAALERALHIFESHEAEASDLGDARFSLARGLWDAGRDRKRALALAQGAKQAFLQAGEAHKKELGEVSLWLARHPAP
jgi:tetratricopeptide (TPR) repeat protein